MILETQLDHESPCSILMRLAKFKNHSPPIRFLNSLCTSIYYLALSCPTELSRMMENIYQESFLSILLRIQSRIAQYSAATGSLPTLLILSLKRFISIK